MRPVALARLALPREPGPALDALPTGPGVGQLLGPEGKSLLIGTASNLRRWAAANLGLARPAAGKGARRPKPSLAGIAEEVAWVETDGPFRQRLAYERLQGELVPLAARRDLRPPAFLHLDPRERFPRVSVRSDGGACQFGPFRDRRAAQKAKDVVQRRFALRPCDYEFEPDPQLPLGLACLYAQVRSCAAPCLVRSSEPEYHELAVRASAWLATPAGREDAGAVPRFVSEASGRALIVDVGRRGVGLVPLRAGRVLDAAVLAVAASELPAALERLRWPEAEGPSDWPWLTAWLRGARARASFVAVREGWTPAELAAAVEPVLAFAAPASGGNVGATRGEA